MTQGTNQRTRQGRFPRSQITFQKNNHPRLQQGCQHSSEALCFSFLRQWENSGNIGRMHDQQTSSVDWTAFKAELRQWATALGFSRLGVARANVGTAARGLQDWLAQGYHGEMDYMARHAHLRSAPADLHPGTLTVLSVTVDYLPHTEMPAPADQGEISRYAQGRDYHKLIRQRLEKLAQRIVERVGPMSYRPFSDSAPVMEVEFATQASLGWRGKHSLLLTRQGSWHFIGEIYCDLPIPPDTPLPDHCGRCTSCIEACPTAAIVAPYQVDARRCISYLTIELAGSIPEDLRPLIGNRIYGCDDCQQVCPWNRFAQLGDPAFRRREALNDNRLEALFAWTEAQFDTELAGSPIRRIGHERWLRNIAVAIGNAPASQALQETLISRQDHPSAVVREHVNWALARQKRQNEAPAKVPPNT